MPSPDQGSMKEFVAIANSDSAHKPISSSNQQIASSRYPKTMVGISKKLGRVASTSPSLDSAISSQASILRVSLSLESTPIQGKNS